MFEQLLSILFGTAGLTLVAVVSLWLSIARDAISIDKLRIVRRIALAGIVLHICHFAEESLTGFYVRFPELLGLVPWSRTFFMSINLVWIAIWILCIPLLSTYPRSAIFPIWFLAIASTVNGIAHPLLSLAAGAYFPGLWSSPLVGILGLVLLRALVSGTRRCGASRGAT